MRYKQFGNTGLQVSEMALGTWGIGGAGWDDYSEESRLDAICAAIENGVNFIDTAPAYNAGVAERYIGKVMKDLGVRQKMVLATKCGTEFINGTYVRDCSAKTIIRQCEESLQNLQTDYIDLYMVHWPDVKVPIEETMDALKQLKQQGKILHVAASNFGKELLEEASQYCPIEAYQTQYSMVFRTNEEALKFAAQQGMGTMGYGSLGGGILSGAFRETVTYAESHSRNRFYKHFHEPMFSKVMKLVEVMDGIAAERHVPLAQIALNWAVQKEFISTCIVGAQSRFKVEENCASFSWELTQEEIITLDNAIQHYLDEE